MPANKEPIFPLIPKYGYGKVLTADSVATNKHDGTSSTAVCVFTAGANGSRIDEIKALPLGTNVATALRIFINNGSANTTAANNSLYLDVTAPAATISETAGLTPISLLPYGSSPLILPPDYKLYALVGTTIAAGINISVIGSDY